MTRVFDSFGQKHESHFECVHLIKRLSEDTYHETFAITRTPTQPNPTGQRVLNQIGTAELTYAKVNAPWSTHK